MAMVEKKKAVKTAPRYCREELAANAGVLFGVKPEVVAGALHEAQEEELTIEETRKRIDGFRIRRVI
jgi:hypothetical protein